MATTFLTALPVYNEAPSLDAVLDEVARYSPHTLVVDDGSTDTTSKLLSARNDIAIKRHQKNLGYGAALKTAFCHAVENDFDIVVTIDCDGQHEPQRIPRFVAACETVDIVSGSRYLKRFSGDSRPPADRRLINQKVAAEINRRLGLRLTDAFCGFKAYRVESLKRLQLDENGYAMPLELWVQASHAGLKIMEIPVPVIYLDEDRAFGGELDNPATRLDYYYRVLERSIAAVQRNIAEQTSTNLCGESVG